jgi:MFS family permease
VPALAVGLFLVGFGLGGQIPISETIWASYFGRRYLGQVRSVALPISLLLGAVGPQFAAIYFDRVGNYNGAFVALAMLWTFAAILVLMIRRPHSRGAPPVRVPAPAPAAAPALAFAAAGAAAPPRSARPALGWASVGSALASSVVNHTRQSSLGFARPSNGLQRALPAGDEAARARPAPRRRTYGLQAPSDYVPPPAPRAETREYMFGPRPAGQSDGGGGY